MLTPLMVAASPPLFIRVIVALPGRLSPTFMAAGLKLATLMLRLAGTPVNVPPFPPTTRVFTSLRKDVSSTAFICTS